MMGQSARSKIRPSGKPSVVPRLSVFLTNLGWFGLVGIDERLMAVFIGHASENDVHRAVARQFDTAGRGDSPRDGDWHPELRRRLEQYALGARVEFRDIDLALPSLSEFQQQVINATRRIRYGKTLTYGELAAKAGYPPRGTWRGNGDVVEPVPDRDPLPPRGSPQETSREATRRRRALA